VIQPNRSHATPSGIVICQVLCTISDGQILNVISPENTTELLNNHHAEVLQACIGCSHWLISPSTTPTVIFPAFCDRFLMPIQIHVEVFASIFTWSLFPPLQKFRSSSQTFRRLASVAYTTLDISAADAIHENIIFFIFDIKYKTTLV
jgi:hypothetical protein